MMRQFMTGLPRGLEEAAEIDGANLWKTFWTIVMPLSKPALITLSIFSFMGTWQSFTWPLIVTHSEHMRVLPVALRYFDSSQGTNYSLLMTGSVLMMLPMIVLFVFRPAVLRARHPARRTQRLTSVKALLREPAPSPARPRRCPNRRSAPLAGCNRCEIGSAGTRLSSSVFGVRLRIWKGLNVGNRL